MEFDIFFSICQTEVHGYLPDERTMFANFFEQADLADRLGFGTAWVAESHLSTEVQKSNPGAVIPFRPLEPRPTAAEELDRVPAALVVAAALLLLLLGANEYALGDLDWRRATLKLKKPRVHSGWQDKAREQSHKVARDMAIGEAESCLLATFDQWHVNFQLQPLTWDTIGK